MYLDLTFMEAEKWEKIRAVLHDVGCCAGV